MPQVSNASSLLLELSTHFFSKRDWRAALVLPAMCAHSHAWLVDNGLLTIHDGLPLLRQVRMRWLKCACNRGWRCAGLGGGALQEASSNAQAQLAGTAAQRASSHRQEPFKEDATAQKLPEISSKRSQDVFLKRKGGCAVVHTKFLLLEVALATLVRGLARQSWQGSLQLQVLRA